MEVVPGLSYCRGSSPLWQANEPTALFEIVHSYTFRPPLSDHLHIDYTLGTQSRRLYTRIALSSYAVPYSTVALVPPMSIQWMSGVV